MKLFLSDILQFYTLHTCLRVNKKKIEIFVEYCPRKSSLYHDIFISYHNENIFL